MRRKDKEIKDQEIIKEILRGNTVCRIALSDNNLPYLIPMNYGYDGRAIYLHSARDGKKIDILKVNSRVCFEVTESIEPKMAEKACSFSTKYRSVIGFGSAAEVLQPEGKRAGMEVIMYQQTGRKGWSFPERDIEEIAVLKISVDSVSGKESL